MRPILFEIFGWGVPSWHFFFAGAALTAYLTALMCVRRAVAAGHQDAVQFADSLGQLFSVCYISGWFGARALSIFVEQFDVHTAVQFFDALFSIGPMTFYGGAGAAVLCGTLYVRLRKIDLKFALDCGIIGGVFALGVGRIGCHLNGDDFGLPLGIQTAPPWWAVRYELLQDGGLYRYPVQLEETVASVIIGFFGLILFRKTYLQGTSAVNSSRRGHAAAWVALLSAAHRFFNEGFRGDPRGLFFGTQISTSSGISLLIAVFCAYCLLRMRTSGGQAPQ